MNIHNVYTLPEGVSGQGEFVEHLAEGDDILIERILSIGHTTPEGDWYDQERDEWVVLLRGSAKLLFEDGSEAHLREGDALCIPAHRKHRVTFTSSKPPCIWLAVHAEMSAW